MNAVYSVLYSPEALDYTVDDSSLIVTVIRIFYSGRDVESITNTEKD